MRRCEVAMYDKCSHAIPCRLRARFSGLRLGTDKPMLACDGHAHYLRDRIELDD